MKPWSKTTALRRAAVLLLAGGLSLPALLAGTTGAGAFTVYCTNCGTEWTQLANKATEADQLVKQIAQLQQQIAMYRNMVTNTMALPQQVWGSAMRDIARVNAVIQQGKALAATAGNLDQEFSRRYGGYRDFLNQTGTVDDLTGRYADWTDQTLDAARSAMKGAGLLYDQMTDEDATIRQIQGMSESSQGQMQALQAGNQMAAQTARQVQKLRELTTLQLQMQANYIAAERSEQAARQAEMQRFFSVTPNFNWQGGKGY